jgi:plasmid maintenance system antidote protein VapI
MTTISDVLREAVVGSGLSLQRLSELTGVQRASLSRFVRGERTLRLDMADRLATYLGLELMARRRAKDRS